jgi:hypothetical protein
MADTVTTTSDVPTQGVEPAPTSTKSVNLTSPTGTKVTASPSAAEKLLTQKGWSKAK